MSDGAGAPSDDEVAAVAGGASFVGVGDVAAFLAGEVNGILRGFAADMKVMVEEDATTARPRSR